MAEIKLKITNLLVTILQEGKSHYIAYSPALRLYGYSNNVEESVTSLKKNIGVFFTIHQRNNTLSQKMTSLGWKQTDHKITQPVDIKVPIELLVNAQQKGTRNVRVRVPSFA